MTTVTAVLVSHDGARWLPRVLRHLDDLTRRPDRLVAVDTGSTDGSPDILRDHLAAGQVVTAGPIGFGEALRQALTQLPPAADPDEEWVWLLHDDAAPAPDALEELLLGADRAPHASVLGPKLREWPSLRRLLEIGATVSGTGRREVGLERGEYDQGQHDAAREVLAVGSAGMLVRRGVLEEIGFDDLLPATWSDLDFGWTATSAGHVVRTVPTAVVFHADATRTGRRAHTRGAALRRADRVGAITTLLAHAPGWLVPWVALRLTLGGLLRAVGLLLVRAPGEAWAEVRSLTAVLRLRRLHRARRARRRTARVPRAQVRSLLAPWWTPYRNGLDEVSDLVQAYLRDVAAADAGAARGRVLLRPGVLLGAGVLALSLWASRSWILEGPGALPALLPAPGSAWDWWDTYVSTLHPTGVGSTASAPPYLLPAALLATVTWASATAAATLLLVLALPVAALGTHRFLAPMVGDRPATGAGLAYVLVVVAAGSMSQGRLGTLVVVAVLPWLVSVSGGLFAAEKERRRRAMWRAALLLWLAASFVPLVLLPAAVLAGAVAAVRAARRLPALAVAAPVVLATGLILPWSALVWMDVGWTGWLAEAGPAYAAGVGEADPVRLLLARPAAVGEAPLWPSAVLVAVALLALLRRATRVGVVRAWWVAVTALTVGVAVLLGSGEPRWVGTWLLLSHGALVVAVALGAAGLGEELTGRTFGVRQLLGTLAGLAAAAAMLATTGWWVAADPLPDPRLELPSYMRSAAETDLASGVLVLRGRHDETVSFDVRRGGGPHLGEESLHPLPAREEAMAEAVAELLTDADADAATALAQHGIGFVVAAEPVDATIASSLDAAAGLTAASAGESGARAWRVLPETSFGLPRAGWRGAVRPVLVAAQVLGLLAALVLAAPARRPVR